MPSYDQQTIFLVRDNPSCPWGFRIQGGVDLRLPLIVQRVFLGSPAERQLLRGDTIESINNCNVAYMTHDQVENLINAAGLRLTMCIQRPVNQEAAITASYQNFQESSPSQYGSLNRYSDTQQPVRPVSDFGVSYTSPRKHEASRASYLNASPVSPSPRYGSDFSVINKLQDSINAVNRYKQDSSGMPELYNNENEDNEDYNYVPVSEKKKLFSQPSYQPPPPIIRRPSPQRFRAAPKSYVSNNTYDYKPVNFGWTPSAEKLQAAARAQGLVDTTPIFKNPKGNVISSSSKMGSSGGVTNHAYNQPQRSPNITTNNHPAQTRNHATVRSQASRHPVKGDRATRRGKGNADQDSDHEYGVSEF